MATCNCSELSFLEHPALGSSFGLKSSLLKRKNHLLHIYGDITMTDVRRTDVIESVDGPVVQSKLSKVNQENIINNYTDERKRKIRVQLHTDKADAFRGVDISPPKSARLPVIHPGGIFAPFLCTPLATDQMDCSICFDQLRKPLGMPECCKHVFCFDCLNKWTESHNTCPIDRMQFHTIRKKNTVDGPVIETHYFLKANDTDIAFTLNWVRFPALGVESFQTIQSRSIGFYQFLNQIQRQIFINIFGLLFENYNVLFDIFERVNDSHLITPFYIEEFVDEFDLMVFFVSDLLLSIE
ncbi:hypothetical protein ACTXT7_005832 [Hymenolepis weldensis]